MRQHPVTGLKYPRPEQSNQEPESRVHSPLEEEEEEEDEEGEGEGEQV